MKGGVVGDEVTLDRFREERGRFQSIMGDAKLTADQVDEAFKGLVWLYAHLAGVTKDERERATVLLESAGVEHNTRQFYRRLKEAQDVF